MSSIPETINAATLADMLGISANRVSVLAAEGVLTKAGRGKYVLADSLRGYIAYAKDNPTGRKRHASDQKHRLTAAQADLAELKLAQANGDLLPAAEVAREWQGIVVDLRARLLAMPARVAAALGLERAEAAALDAEVRAALEDIANDG